MEKQMENTKSVDISEIQRIIRTPVQRSWKMSRIEEAMAKKPFLQVLHWRILAENLQKFRAEKTVE